jgi:hypothetical protein
LRDIRKHSRKPSTISTILFARNPRTYRSFVLADILERIDHRIIKNRETKDAAWWWVSLNFPE